MSAMDTASLASRRDALYRRLEAGYAKIARGVAAGEVMTEWEDFWLLLLKEYERLCDELAEAGDGGR